MDCYKLIKENINYSYKPQIKNDTAFISISNSPIADKQLRKMISMLSIVVDKPTITKIRFCGDNINFSDKLSYILFECLLYALIKDYKKEISFDIKKRNLHITTAGFADSLSISFIGGIKGSAEFINDFDRLTISNKHYRRVVLQNKPLEYLSSIFTEIKFFLDSACIDIKERFNTKIDKGYIERVSEVVSELANNAYEHASADCLIDIDITPDWTSKSGNRVFAINLAVVNFSDILLGDKLCAKMRKLGETHIEKDGLMHKYEQVHKAYEYHKRYFGYSYNSNDFYNIASFQNKISSRVDRIMGGTGLPQLLKMLMEQSELDICYMLSGNEGLRFCSNYLEFKNDWIGFNMTHDFLYDIPDNNSILHSDLFIPGCAFNLKLILKMEEC